MDQITAFVRQILITAIFFSIIIIIVPDEKYKKYIKFFCSAFLVVLLISPIKNLLESEQYIYGIDTYEITTKEKYEEIQDMVIKEEYIRNLKNEIQSDLENFDINLSQVEILLNEDMSVNSVIINAYINGENNINTLRATISKKFNISEENINFNNGE
jgi:stage III sporulation protein AF